MFYITISNGLLQDGHRKRMGSAVWEFMWCIDRVTKIDSKGMGWVLGGKPIKLSELAEKMEVAEDTISANLTKLEEEGYIKKTRTPYGISIKVTKAQKKFQKSDTKEITGVDVPKKEEKEPEIVLPEWLNKKAWIYWVAYRKELKKKMTPKTMEMQIKWLSERKEAHVAIIKRSIMNGWQGLFDLPKNSKEPFGKISDRARAYEKRLEEDKENREMKENVKGNDVLRKIAEDIKILQGNMKIEQ